jgi:hypothetical protein
MKNALPVYLLVPLLLASPLVAADPPAKLDSLAWLVGRWQSPEGDRVLSEEHWSAPAGGAMIGMFRLVSGGKPSVYELILIEEEADGVWMRLRHFQPQMVAREQEPIKLKLTSSANEKLVFENPIDNKPKRIIYTLVGNDLIATVETERDDKTAAFSLKMRRVK